MKYRTFCVGLLADYNKELKRALDKIWRFSMHFSDKIPKIGGTESLEYDMPIVHE